MIPRRLVRTVPAETTDEVEAFWDHACRLHPDWIHVTHRDPVDRHDFPLTRHLWDTCESGAQLADLIRIEDLWWRGGVYVDSDVEVFKSFTPLLGVAGFAAYEDEHHICQAVIGFRPNHRALEQVIELAIQRHDEGTWAAGVGAFTDVMRDRGDIVILPPASFYAVHFRNKQHLAQHKPQPWEYASHKWSHSWASCVS